MKMIIGLGNPGKKYAPTKHNIGFITLDELASREKVSFNKNQFEGDIAELFLNGEKVLLVKPQTFMNESGRCVRPLMDYYQLNVEDIVVIYDDMDLPVGKIRLREKGSAGGHNGIKSLIQHLGTQNFKRIKIGINRPYSGQDVVSHVLSPFPKDTHEEMLLAVKTSADACEDWVAQNDFVGTMNRFNGRI
ncbi:aminoacyl-tRNA hydrolase [Vagococcus xieshaowenii]|uniref:Peptidyl-tRNA hydrolase n=1 Tax=Vagococcus xieshaowenii TaxID=2562451 RepID=A0A4Z0D605_9ENTE|nr:aminoacyl-tRNA hydrolase [Vagococcus xieshaowenii]QCA28022.1 aminoacyl-tRNA hydrolase [Vagococcus xieshaowenii]TFZ40300.1 aminoacyl-tRNA hydrolase [Vagococcus xieshaowenii]